MTGLTDKQHEARKTRGGGSSIPAYKGFNPYVTPYQQWQVANGLLEVPVTDEMAAGNAYEDGIAEMTERELGGVKTYKPDSVFHPEYPDAIVVHFDRLCDEDSLGIQIKHHWPGVGRAGKNPWSYKGQPDIGSYHNRLVPLHILMQCQVEMMVAQAAFGGKWGERWLLSSHFGGPKPRLYWIRRDIPLQEKLLSSFLKFWARHLDPNGPQEEPIGYKWIGSPKKEPRIRKMSDDEKLTAPLPFEGDVEFSAELPF